MGLGLRVLGGQGLGLGKERRDLAFGEGGQGLALYRKLTQEPRPGDPKIPEVTPRALIKTQRVSESGSINPKP